MCMNVYGLLDYYLSYRYAERAYVPDRNPLVICKSPRFRARAVCEDPRNPLTNIYIIQLGKLQIGSFQAAKKEKN